MAQPANTFDRYDASPSVREDFSNILANVSPEKVPVTTAIGRSKATNTYHEWQRDDLAAPNADNALVDGDDFAGMAITPTRRVGNYTQIFAKQPVVSRRADIVKKAGKSTEMAYQMANKMLEIKRDIEAMVLSENVAVAGDSVTASKSAGMAALVYTNTDHGAGGSTPAHTAGAQTVAPTAGTARAFAESQLQAVSQLAFTNSGEVPPMLVMSPNHKRIFSTFTGIAANRFQVGKKEQGRIIGGADVYMSDFGEITVVPHYAMVGATYVLGIEPDHASVAYLDGIKADDIGKTGDSTKKLIVADCTLRVNAEAAMTKIADLTA